MGIWLLLAGHPDCHPPPNNNKGFVALVHILSIQTRFGPCGKIYMVLSGWSLAWKRGSGNECETRRGNKAKDPRWLGHPNKILDLISMTIEITRKFYR